MKSVESAAGLDPAVAKRLVVITAPSGAGKSTLIHRLMQADPTLVFSVSHTTRAPRPGETHGVNYYFTGPAEFERMVSAGEFLEHAEVHGRQYGTSFAEIRRLAALGKRVVLDIDVQGSLELQKRYPALYIFISVASVDVLRRRLEQRATDSQETIERRMANAVYELSFQERWPHVVVNDQLERAEKELHQLIDSHLPRLAS